MPDWITNLLSGLQRTVVSGLAAELRAGGLFTIFLAFALGALHALTPGHGKAALTAYFIGQEAKLSTALRITLTAAFLHVVMGTLVFLIIRFVMSQTALVTGRASPSFVVAGYFFILVAGVIMLIQSWRAAPAPGHAHALTIGIGLLPCPLTITVLGFAWVQGSITMLLVTLISLAAGIAFTIGAVAIAAIAIRRLAGMALIEHLTTLDRSARVLQGIAGAAIVVFSVYAILTA